MIRHVFFVPNFFFFSTKPLPNNLNNLVAKLYFAFMIFMNSYPLQFQASELLQKKLRVCSIPIKLLYAPAAMGGIEQPRLSTLFWHANVDSPTALAHESLAALALEGLLDRAA